MKDFEKTQHYTSQADLICGNLTKYIPNDALLIEPFVGKGEDYGRKRIGFSLVYKMLSKIYKDAF